MLNYLDNQIITPPELPPYLKDVYELNPVVGAPHDQELIVIHAMIRVAQKTVDVPGIGSKTLLSRLSEHLFDVQMARYRSKYLAAAFPEASATPIRNIKMLTCSKDTTYAPPALPVHLSVQLEPVSGAPSEEEIIKVQDAIRSYQQLANVSSMFDPNVHMKLSQHLFDIQMAKHMQCAKQSCVVSNPCSASSSNATRIIERTVDIIAGDAEAMDYTQTEADAGSDQPTRSPPDSGVRDALERSNRLAEQANQLAERSNLLIERSNQIAERANQQAEQSNRPTEQANNLVEKVIELLGRWNEHFEQSNCLAELLTKPVEKLEEVLRDINRVLVGIQHAIVRVRRTNWIYKDDDAYYSPESQRKYIQGSRLFS